MNRYSRRTKLQSLPSYDLQRRALRIINLVGFAFILLITVQYHKALGVWGVIGVPTLLGFMMTLGYLHTISKINHAEEKQKSLRQETVLNCTESPRQPHRVDSRKNTIRLAGSKPELAWRYIRSYLYATLAGVVLYSIIAPKLGAILFLPLALIYFPKATAFLFGCYEVNPDPVQLIIEYGSYFLCAIIGILTKLRIFYTVFVIMLLMNIGGCVVAGIEERAQKNPNHRIELTDDADARLDGN